MGAKVIIFCKFLFSKFLKGLTHSALMMPFHFLTNILEKRNLNLSSANMSDWCVIFDFKLA